MVEWCWHTRVKLLKKKKKKIMALKISENAKVQMPMKTVAHLITLVAIGWAYLELLKESTNTARN